MKHNKLKQQKGETLVETLAALLIATLSVMMLTSAITAGARINLKNREADQKITDDLKAAEECTDSLGDKTLVIQFNGMDKIQTAVTLYGQGDGKFASYQIEPAEGETP